MWHFARSRQVFDNGLSPSTGHDPTTALTLDALNRAAYTKADNHFNHPQIMKPKPAKNQPDPPSEGLRPPTVPIGIRVRHDGNGYQLFLPVIAIKGAGTRVTFLLLQ